MREVGYCRWVGLALFALNLGAIEARIVGQQPRVIINVDPPDARVAVWSTGSLLRSDKKGEHWEALAKNVDREYAIWRTGYITQRITVNPLLRALKTVETVKLERQSTPRHGGDWINSADMEMIPIGPGVWMASTETTVAAYRRFQNAVLATPMPMITVSSEGWSARGFTWKNPGFDRPQTDDHPVVGVSWHDAMNFCDWLTAEERMTGAIEPDQYYSLPTKTHWDLGSGSGGGASYFWRRRDAKTSAFLPQTINLSKRARYFWGESEIKVSPISVGNYAGPEAKGPRWHEHWLTIDRKTVYNDGYPQTAPVRSFDPLIHKVRDPKLKKHFREVRVYDLGGNVAEWCLDDYAWGMNDLETLTLNPQLRLDADESGRPLKLVRGASWYNDHEVDLRIATCAGQSADERNDRTGFRIVLLDEGVRTSLLKN